MTGIQFAESVLEARFVFRPFAGQEYEAVEHHSLAENGDVFDGFFEDDVEVAVEVGGVGYPPEVEPVCVNLVSQSASMVPTTIAPGKAKHCLLGEYT